jgi:hypothetical protein
LNCHILKNSICFFCKNLYNDAYRLIGSRNFKGGLKMQVLNNFTESIQVEIKTKEQLEIELLREKFSMLEDRIFRIESEESERKIAYHMAEIEKIKLSTSTLKEESLSFKAVGIIQKETFWSGYKEEFVFRKFTDLYDMKTANLNDSFRDLEFFTITPSGDYVVLEKYIYQDWYSEHGSGKHYYDATGYRMVTKDGNIELRDNEQYIVYVKEK